MDINAYDDSLDNLSEEKSSNINQETEEKLFNLMSLYRKRAQVAEEKVKQLETNNWKLNVLRNSTRNQPSSGCKHRESKNDMKKHYENEIEALRMNLMKILAEKLQQAKLADEKDSYIKAVLDENRELKKSLEEKEIELQELKKLEDEDEKSQDLEVSEGEVVLEEKKEEATVEELSETSDAFVSESQKDKTQSQKEGEEFEERRRMIQEQLVLILHAKKCEHPEFDQVENKENDNSANQCPVAHCMLMKTVLRHRESCQDQECEYSHCGSTRVLMKHWNECRRVGCILCEDVRQGKCPY